MRTLQRIKLLVAERPLLGVYLIVYIVSLYFLYGGSPSFMRRGRRSPNKMIPLGGLVLFLTITPVGSHHSTWSALSLPGPIAMDYTAHPCLASLHPGLRAAERAVIISFRYPGTIEYCKTVALRSGSLRL